MRILLQRLLKLSAIKLAFILFSPVLLAGALELVQKPLVGFLVLQFFIEGFVVWQVAIAVVLNRLNPNTKLFAVFAFNMAV